MLLRAVMLFAVAGVAIAQTFPSQPVRLVSPFPPGGSVDIVARLISEPIARQLGGTVLVENRSGASGNIGMEIVAKARPDGHTIVLNTIPLVTNQSLFDKLTYDFARDFAPIGMVATSQHVLVIPNRMAAKTVAELVNEARAKPGRLSYASAGTGSTFHLCAELFKDATKTFILHVPYRGGGPALQDTLAGQVDLSFPILSAAAPHIKAGNLRALAVTGGTRSSILPGVPTLAEAGIKDFQFTQWLALLAPAGTPAEIIARLNAALNAALKTADVKDKFDAGAIETWSTTPEQARTFLVAEAARFAALIKSRGITGE